MTLTLIEPAAYWVARAYGEYSQEEAMFVQFFEEIGDPPTENDLIKFLNLNGLVPPGRDPRSLPLWSVWNTMKIVLLSARSVIEHTDDVKRLQILKDTPVLLVRGRESTGFNSGIISLLAQAFGSNAHVLELPDAHASHIVAKDQFLASLEEHIRMEG